VIVTVAKKELRGYFNSAVAVIFLAAFLAVTFYAFFEEERFFARGLTDLRPLFEWMPKLLIILVSALAMRLWAEERRAGTLELMLTLPVPRWKLVLGKFIAGMALIAIALALTLGLPITISTMGNLDMGPVLGGYLATLLLAAAYLSIGMCVSAATDNQIVAFVGTAFACLATYAIGLDPSSDLGRALGTGARFESVARGVLDLRDLAYYAALVAIGVAVNVILLGRLTWGRGQRARDRRMAALVAVGLVIGNAIALNLWLSQVRRARIDLTEGGIYSLSAPTERILGNLDEKLLIRGYFSAKTHPKLAPLVPQLRDLLEEYRIAGEGNVRVELVDPSDNNDAKREAKERFNIEPKPLPFEDENEASVVNAYFDIAIAYGDQSEVLSLNELLQERARDIGEGSEITLKNPEYQLTKAIKKTISAFSSIDSLFASMPGKVTLTTFVTPKSLPEEWKDGPAKLKAAIDKLAKGAGSKLEVKTVEPQTEDEMMKLYEQYKLRPYSDLVGLYYLHVLIEVGTRKVLVAPQELNDAALDKSLVDGLKRAAPGFTRVVGVWSPPAPPQDPRMAQMGQNMPAPQTFQAIQRSLGGNYDVREVDLVTRVADDVEVLVLGGPADLDPQAIEQLDQFVMRGGALVALAGRYRLAPARGISVEKVTTGLEDLFKKWGVTVTDELVMDPRADKVPVPRERDVGNGQIVTEMAPLPYPFFVRMTGDQLASGSVITSGLPGTVMHFASPVKVEAKVGDDTRKVETLLRSSGEAWLSASPSVQPDFTTHGEKGFGIPKDLAADKRGSQVLGVAITGGFQSGVAKPRDPKAPKPAAPEKPDKRLLEHSPPDTRMVIFGSSAFASDAVLGFAQQMKSDLALSNVELVHNAVDWALADTDLLSIRAQTTAARALTIEPDKRTKWRDINIALGFLGLAAVVGGVWLRRRNVTPVIKPQTPAKEG
jgi:ABC-2 type transport system permease protein